MVKEFSRAWSREFGSDNDLSLLAAQRLAAIYSSKNMYVEAESLFESTISAASKRYGDDSPQASPFSK